MASGQIFAQPWLDLMNNKADADLPTTRSAFEAYWHNRPEEKEITKMWTQILDSRYIQYTQEEIKCEKGCTILSIE